MAIKTYVGTQNGNFATASNWSTHKAPHAGDILIDNYYNTIINDVTINHEVIDLDQARFKNDTRTTASLTLDNATLGKDTLVLSQRSVGLGIINLNDSYLRGVLLNVAGQTQIDIKTDQYAVNFGTIASVGAEPGQSSLGIIDNGTFSNEGVMEGNGVGGLLYMGGVPGNRFSNIGLIEAAANAYVGINENVDNRGTMHANGGSLGLDANVLQTADGSISLTNNGTVTLGGACSGGIINIQSGMLDFSPAQFITGHTATSDFHTDVDFTGSTGSLGFGRNDISETFNAEANKLEVTIPSIDAPTFPLVSIQLQGSYTAVDFSVVGQSVVYTAHHSAVG